MRATLLVVLSGVFAALLLVGGCASESGVANVARADAEQILRGDLGEEPNLIEAWADMDAGRLQERGLSCSAQATKGRPVYQ